MKFTPGLRWACYAIAALATAAAMWRVDHAEAPAAAVQAVRPVPRGTAWPVAASGADATVVPAPGGALAILKQRLDAAISGGQDPFSDGAAPAPAAAVAAAVQQQAAAAAAAAQPVAAAPAFTYVGRWQEQGRTVVFLQAGDHVLAVRGPGPLEGGYVAEAITPEGVAIKSATGERQVVTFAGAAPGNAAPGAPVAQTTASTPPGAPEEN